LPPSTINVLARSWGAKRSDGFFGVLAGRHHQPHDPRDGSAWISAAMSSTTLHPAVPPTPHERLRPDRIRSPERRRAKAPRHVCAHTPQPDHADVKVHDVLAFERIDATETGRASQMGYPQVRPAVQP